MAVTINFYDKLAEYIGDATIDLDGDSFYHILLNTSHTFDATDSVRTDISTNQIATGAGYTQATGGGTGEALGSPTWVESSGTVTFDADDTTWTASGGSIVSSDCVIFDDTPTSPADPICFSVDFDGEQTAGDGTDFLISWNGSGIFTSVFTDA